MVAAWCGIVGAALAILTFFGISQFTAIFPSGAESSTPAPSSDSLSPPSVDTPTFLPSAPPSEALPQARGISHDEYTRRVDGICAHWFARFDPNVDSTQWQNPQFWNMTISLYSAMIEEWEAVPIPQGEEVVVAQILDAQKRDLDSFREAARYASEGDYQAMQDAVQQGASDETEQIDQVRRFGLQTCG